MTVRSPLRDRILKRIEIVDECWVWRGAIRPSGYGAIGSGVGSNSIPVHRAAYMEFVGPIPEGLHIDHLCRTRACVNPKHLEAVTQAENTRRGARWRSANTTHCKRGHEFNESNTIRGPRGRGCRTCHNLYQKARRRGMTVDEFLVAPYRVIDPERCTSGKHLWSEPRAKADGRCRLCRNERERRQYRARKKES